MENPISLRIWAPNAEGQTRQFTSGWDEYSSYDVPVDPTINGDIDYIVEAKGGFEIYRGVFNSLRYRSREYCIIVELRIKSGFVLVHQSDKQKAVSPGVLLREILNHITETYLKESFGKYKYIDEEHVTFEAARIQNIIAPYTTVSTWGRRIKMVGSGNVARIHAATDSEVDSVLMAVPTATSLEGYSELVIANFTTGSNMMAQSVQADPSCQRIMVRCQRADGATVDKELGDRPEHLTLKDFALDPEVYKPVEVILERDNILDNFRLDKKVFNPAQGVTVSLYPEQQRVAVTISPVEQTQVFTYEVKVKDIGEVTPQLINSVHFKNAPLNGGTISATGARLKKFRHSTRSELLSLFTLPSNSEYTVESVEIHGNTISVRVEMLPKYAEIRRNQQASAQNHRKGARPQSNTPAPQQEASDIKYILDVNCPISTKHNTVAVRLILWGNGKYVVEQFEVMAEGGRIVQELDLPSASQKHIELDLPSASQEYIKRDLLARYEADLYEECQPKETLIKLKVSHWHKVNPFKRFFRRFYFRYDDNRSFWTRLGVITLLFLMLVGGGFALGAAFYPIIKEKIEESRSTQQPQETVETPKIEDKQETASEESEQAEAQEEGETPPAAETDKPVPERGEADAPAETADEAADAKKDGAKAPSGAASKAEREKAEKQQTDSK